MLCRALSSVKNFSSLSKGQLSACILSHVEPIRALRRHQSLDGHGILQRLRLGVVGEILLRRGLHLATLRSRLLVPQSIFSLLDVALIDAFLKVLLVLVFNCGL